MTENTFTFFLLKKIEIEKFKDSPHTSEKKIFKLLLKDKPRLQFLNVIYD